MIDWSLVQRIALYTTLGLVLMSVDLSYEQVGFWCIVALYLANEHVTGRQCFERGVATGIEMMTDMTEQQRAEVMALVKEAQKDDDNE